MRSFKLIQFSSSSSYSLCSIFFKQIFWWVFLLASPFFILFLICTRNVLTKYIRSSSHRSCFDRLGWSSWFDTYNHLSVQSTFLLFLAYSWLISDVLQTLRLQFLQVILHSDPSLSSFLSLCNSSYYFFRAFLQTTSKLVFFASLPSSFFIVFLSCLQLPLSNLRFLLLLSHSNPLFNSM